MRQTDTALRIYEVAERLIDTGRTVDSRNGPARELIAQSYTFVDPDPGFVIAGRGMSEKIRAIEMLTICGQTDISHRMPVTFERFTDDGLLRGAYGQRLYGQLTRVVEELTLDPLSRRAVATIYSGHRDLGDPSHDIPCTLSLQFLIRDETLWLVVSMRSSDAYLGLPYDVAQFTAVGHAVATAVRVPFAGLTINCGSSHIYEKDISAFAQLDRPSWRPHRWRELFPNGASLGDIATLCRRALDGETVGSTRFLYAVSRQFKKGNA